MKNILFCFVFILLIMNVIAQNGYDHIDRDAFYILKTGSDTKSTNKLSVSKLDNHKTVEYLFGKPKDSKSYFEEMSNQNYTRIVYEDGLELRIPEIEKSLRFIIISDKYTLFLASGQEIRVGMDGEELKTIFPNSYARRIIIKNTFNKGKTSISVFFSRVIDNKLIIEDSSVNFILSKENSKIEQIRTFYPQ